MNEGIWGRSKWGRTHSYGLKVDISSGDLDGDAWYRMRSGLGEEEGHTSKEVPNMLSLTKDMSLAEEEGKEDEERWVGDDGDNEGCVGEEDWRIGLGLALVRRRAGTGEADIWRPSTNPATTTRRLPII